MNFSDGFIRLCTTDLPRHRPGHPKPPPTRPPKIRRILIPKVYEEWFEGKLKRSRWNEAISEAPFMKRFRTTMFKRLIPNLEYIGLLTPRVQHLYEKAGLMTSAGGKSAAELSAQDLLDELS